MFVVYLTSSCSAISQFHQYQVVNIWQLFLCDIFISLTISVISNKSYHVGKTLWEKGKMLVTSIFSFSHNVFKRLLFQGREKSGLFGKELTKLGIHNFEKQASGLNAKLIFIFSYHISHTGICVHIYSLKVNIIYMIPNNLGKYALSSEMCCQHLHLFQQLQYLVFSKVFFLFGFLYPQKNKGL